MMAEMQDHILVRKISTSISFSVSNTLAWIKEFPAYVSNATSAKDSSKAKTVGGIQDPLAALFKGLVGRTIVIPNLKSLSPSWTLEVNPHLESIREEYNVWVKHWFKDRRIRAKIAALDADGFAAMGYPRTGRAEVLNLAKLIAWFFPWDDAIDDAALDQQPADITRYRDETIEVVNESLLSQLEKPSKIHPNPAIQSFWDLGAEIREHSSQESNTHFAHQQCLFVSSSAESQIVRSSAVPVSVAEYLRRREDNIAIHALLELAPYANKTHVSPQWRWENNRCMEEMWKEIAWMGIMSNDLLSLRRELIHGQFESLVPLLMYHEGLGPQDAVDRGLQMIHDSYRHFYMLEEQLYKEVDSEELESVKMYVRAFKDLVMCNLHWSYGLKRYMDDGMLKDDGTVSFDIQIP